MTLRIVKYIVASLLCGTVFIACRDAGARFAIQDIDVITRIELNDVENHVVLSKTERNEWLVSSFKANMANVANLRAILSSVEVQCPLPKMYDSTYSRKKIMEDGIRIRAYKGKELVKSYYLLIAEEDDAEVIGLMDEKHSPYLLELPGRDIDFGDYIVAESVFWENNILFSYNAGQIKYVEIENMETPSNSFSITIADSISLFDRDGNRIPFDKFKMDAYLSYFNNISFDSNLNISDDEKREIISARSLYIMTVRSDTDSLSCYIHPVNDSRPDDYGNPLVYNRDYFHLVVPAKNLFAVASWLKFDILLEELDYFRSE